MERLLLENLARTQAFDQLLKSGSQIDRLAGKYLHQILFQPKQAPREKAINKLQREIVGYFEKQVQPMARKVGIENARKVLDALSPKVAPDLTDPALRRKILIDGNLRAQDRVEIVRTILNDKGNTLDNRLAAYWLEPGGRPQEKLDRLVRLHLEQEQRRAEYEAKLVAFDQKQRESRPAKPKLDYLSAFQSETKQGVREQARRAGTDAETQAFAAKGFATLAWVTVNSSEACPDCRRRQGQRGDAAYWDQQGRPGSGRTVCGAACFCMLVPAGSMALYPSLQQGLSLPPLAAVAA